MKKDEATLDYDDESHDDYEYLALEDYEHLFEVKRIKNVHYIFIKADIDKQFAKIFSKFIDEWCNSDAKLHVLDFKPVNFMHINFFRGVGNYQKKLNEKEKRLVSLNLNYNVSHTIKTNGMTNAFNVISNLDKLKLKTSTSQDNEGFIQGISEKMGDALVEVAQELLESSPEFKSVGEGMKIKINNKFFSEDNYMAILPFECKGFHGDIRLIIQSDVLIGIYNFMMKKDADSLNSKVVDFMKEFLNILFGNIKTRAGEKIGDRIKIGIPIVFNWKDLKSYVHLKTYDISFVYSFEMRDGDAKLNLNIEHP